MKGPFYFVFLKVDDTGPQSKGPIEISNQSLSDLQLEAAGNHRSPKTHKAEYSTESPVHVGSNVCSAEISTNSIKREGPEILKPNVPNKPARFQSNFDDNSMDDYHSMQLQPGTRNDSPKFSSMPYVPQNRHEGHLDEKILTEEHCHFNQGLLPFTSLPNGLEPSEQRLSSPPSSIHTELLLTNPQVKEAYGSSVTTDSRQPIAASEKKVDQIDTFNKIEVDGGVSRNKTIDHDANQNKALFHSSFTKNSGLCQGDSMMSLPLDIKSKQESFNIPSKLSRSLSTNDEELKTLIEPNQTQRWENSQRQTNTENFSDKQKQGHSITDLPKEMNNMEEMWADNSFEKQANQPMDFRHNMENFDYDNESYGFPDHEMSGGYGRKTFGSPVASDNTAGYCKTGKVCHKCGMYIT